MATNEPMPSATLELLPCPFCGSPAEWFDIAGSWGYYSARRGVRCSGRAKMWEPNKCAMLPAIAYDTTQWERGRGTYSVEAEVEVKAAEAWNTRA
jgi:hypothetical protein